MDNDSTRKRVDEIYDTIQKLKDELNKLRNECPHDSYTVGNYGWAPGHFQLARICDACGEYLGEPNEEEVNNLMKEDQ